jgi:CheY-like chemotaxis protein
MRTAIKATEICRLLAEPEDRRLRVIVADGSPRYLDTVCDVLEFHEIVDLVGRAANVEETIQLAVNLQPDLVLMNIEMPSVDVAIAVIMAATDTRIIGLSSAGSIPLQSPSLILAVSALIDKAHLREELLPVLYTLYRYPAASGPLPGLSGFHSNTGRPRAGTFPRKHNSTD